MATDDRERWNDQWAQVGSGTSHRPALVDLVDPWLPPSGRLLDVAGGGSPAALEFCRRGLTVTVADVSDVGLRQARQRADPEGFEITTLELDLETEPLAPGPWDVITIANYFQPSLFVPMIAALAPGGVLGAVLPTATNLERHDRPGAAYLLTAGSLAAMVLDAADHADVTVEVVHDTEDWRPNERHEAHLVARRT